jgi:hypothetical protein
MRSKEYQGLSRGLTEPLTIKDLGVGLSTRASNFSLYENDYCDDHGK